MATTKVDPFTTDSSGRRVLPSFSMLEHDRRFQRVRRFMAEEKLDCLIAPPGEPYEPQANSRYLTQVGGLQGAAWGVVPASGGETSILGSEREHKMWRRNLVWPQDMRWSNSPTDLLIDRLKELGLERARVGVSGLASQYHRAEGIIPYETWSRISSSFPNATFVPATHVLEKSRVVKGEEEIAVIQHICDADEAAIARMMEIARPGLEEADVWMEMADVLTRATADYPARLSLGSNGGPSNASNTMGLPIVMEDGGVLSQEIDARLQGYRAQSNHSILVGSRNREAYFEAMEATCATFLHLVDWLHPGVTVGDLLDELVRTAEGRGGKGGGVTVHTNGLGADRPRVGPGPMASDRDWVIEPGWTFTIKTHVTIVGTGVGAQVGEPVTVGERGARRLGHRDLRPYATG
jgi:Xaa-Pro aminopeptidase